MWRVGRGKQQKHQEEIRQSGWVIRNEKREKGDIRLERERKAYGEKCSYHQASSVIGTQHIQTHAGSRAW